VFSGAIVVESLRVGVSLEDVLLLVRKLSRFEVSGASADQLAVWTILEFEVEDRYAEPLAENLQAVLERPGWYADFHDVREVFVVFPGRVFRYPRGDEHGRAEAHAHGRELDIPELQLDWTG
jgi:hypothetical protein